MADFKKDQLDMFLGVIRKYMQVRGNYSQKDLAEKIEVGVSTISRFINKKTTELDPLLIAKIVAKLDIPLHEIVDFIEEEFTDKFKRMVAFFKTEGQAAANIKMEDAGTTTEPKIETGTIDEALLKGLGTGDKNAKATINTSGTNMRTISVVADPDLKQSLVDKVTSLSPRQKAYLSDFLNLDGEGRDLIVDLGNSLFAYFRQKGVEF